MQGTLLVRNTVRVFIIAATFRANNPILTNSGILLSISNEVGINIRLNLRSPLC